MRFLQLSPKLLVLPSNLSHKLICTVPVGLRNCELLLLLLLLLDQAFGLLVRQRAGHLLYALQERQRGELGSATITTLIVVGRGGLWRGGDRLWGWSAVVGEEKNGDLHQTIYCTRCTSGIY